MNLLPSGSAAIGGDVFDQIAVAIERRGYIVMDGALPPVLLDALFVHLRGLADTGLTRAGIGREGDHQLNRFVRGDETRWLDSAEPAGGDFLAWMEQLRLGLNRRLFLGLFDYEAHYARYAPGAFYRRHLDAFEGGPRNRVLSTVLYLNPNWGPGDGGEMVIYGRDGEAVIETVQPFYGRLAVFLSERFPHEVLPTNCSRYSIAGWFRVNNSLGGVVDPAR